MPIENILSGHALRDAQYQLLAQSLLTELLQEAKKFSQPLIIYISHSWPVFEAEQDSQSLVRLLHFINLLKIAGIEARADLTDLMTYIDENTTEATVILKQFLSNIQTHCQRVLMLGSPSYQT